MQINIQAFLEKYKRFKNPKEEREKIADIISKELGVEIKENQISVTKNTLSIKTNNYIKTEIFLKKDKILKTLNENKFYIKDIK